MVTKALPVFRGSRKSKSTGRVRETDVQQAYFQYLWTRGVPDPGGRKSTAYAGGFGMAHAAREGAPDMRSARLWHFAFSIPNGVYIPGDPKRSAIIMAAMKRTGLKPGVSDVMIAYPVFPFHGAFIELKRGDEKPTEDQQYWLHLMQDRGYYSVCAHGLDDAIRHTEVYCRGGLALDERK